MPIDATLPYDVNNIFARILRGDPRARQSPRPPVVRPPDHGSEAQMRKLLVFQHVASEPLGHLDPLLREAGVRIRYVNFGREPHAQPDVRRFADDLPQHRRA